MTSVNRKNDENFDFSSDSDLRDSVKMEELERETQSGTLIKRGYETKYSIPLGKAECISKSVKQEEDDCTRIGTDVWLRESFKAEDEEKYEKESKGEDKIESSLGYLETIGKRKTNSNEDKAVFRKKSKCLEIGAKKENGNTTWRDMFPNATISDKVDDLCQYKCYPCGKTFKKRSSLASHMKKTKHDPARSVKYKRVNLDRYLTKVVQHKCRICSKTILCDKGQIKDHIDYHKIKSLQNYINMTKAEVINHQKVLLEKRNKSRVKSIRYDEQSELVGNLCVYKCKKCDKTFSNKIVLGQHLKKYKHDHKSKGNHDHYLIKTIVHKCKLCSKLMLCEIQAISSHLKYAHKIGSIDDYLQMTGTKWTENIDLQTFCKINAEKYKISQEVKNHCRFACDICDFSNHTWITLKQHIIRKHNVSANKPTHYATSITFHKCHLCGKLVLCDRTYILQHLMGHKIHVSSYIKKAGLKQASTFREQYISELKSKIQNIPVVEAMSELKLKPNSIPDNKVT